MWFRSLLRGTCSAEYLFAFFLVVTGFCWIVFLAYPISLSFSCAGFRPCLISHPRSWHRRRGLLRLRFHAWRLSSDLPGLRDSPPDLLLRLAWLGVLPLAPFSRLGDLSLTSGPGQHDLVHSFWIDVPVRPFVLRHGISLRCSSFLTHPVLHSSTESLRHLAKRVLFFMALAIAKRVGGVQAVSGTVSFVCHDASLFCAGVCHRDGVLFQFPSSLFLGGFLVGFCSWAGQ